jgi:hypothetical protein
MRCTVKKVDPPNKKKAPTLFQKSKRKHITVQKALDGNRWIIHILPLHMPQEIREYTTLGEVVDQTQLS